MNVKVFETHPTAVIPYDHRGDLLQMICSVQDGIRYALHLMTPEGGVWTLDRIASMVGYDRTMNARHIFDTAVEGLAAQNEIITDGTDVMAAD